MDPVILVGRRVDGGHRDRLWEWCHSRWGELLDWPVAQGFHKEDEGPFSFSVAINRAAAAADVFGEWDVALYVGADWATATADQASDACELALRKGQLVFAHNEKMALTEQATVRLLAGEPLRDAADGELALNTFSGVVAVPRVLWEKVGGFDERFVGWGYEDLAFWASCWALAGGFNRVHGCIYHLWHPRSRAENEENPNHAANQVLGERYLAAKTDRVATLALIAERQR